MDQVIYKPIGGHWACYCIGYNAYDIQDCDYVEDLDPWSANFIGYGRKKVFYENPRYFCYTGVYRNFIVAKEVRSVREYFRCTTGFLPDIVNLSESIIK